MVPLVRRFKGEDGGSLGSRLKRGDGVSWLVGYHLGKGRGPTSNTSTKGTKGPLFDFRSSL